MSPAERRTYGPYEIVSPLGAGGMGEVFKARDTRLNRLVALKVSRSEFTDRFQQEARAIGALNHPLIATLYDVGPDYLVMEYVEGETLRTPLPLARALHYARQILEALEAAHRKGIVHRDLKPGNIMVTKSGIKLLDFGLAKMKAAVASGDETAAMTVTMEGVITGTLQYMSPEQLEGKTGDERSDLFAFGAVLYEMLTGRQAFRGESAASVISAIMTAEPQAARELQSDVPQGVDRIVRRCLAKDPDERWQTAADVRHAIELVQTDSGSPSAATPAQVPARGRLALRWTATAFLAGVLATAAGYRFVQPKPAEPWTFRPLTYSGRTYFPSLSPDGKQAAFFWSGEKDNDFDLYVQLVSAGNPLRLPGSRGRGKTAWSPDSSRLAVLRTDGLYVVPALGGAARRVASLPQGDCPCDVAWAPNGLFFVATAESQGLFSIPGEGGQPRELTRPAGAGDHSPAIASDSRAVAFVRHTSTYNSQILVLPLKADGTAAAEAKQITAGVWDIRNLDWTADGSELIFEGSPGSNNPTLWRISRNGGKAMRLNVPGFIAGHPSVARQSGRLAYVSLEEETKIFKAALGGREAQAPQPLVQAIGYHGDVAVSLDGSRIAFASNRTGTKEIWVANADGTNQTQLTSFDGPAVGSARWSPDGKSITFDGYATGSSDIYVVTADGGNPLRLTNEPTNEVRPSWSHDGKWIYFSSDRGGQRQIWKVSPAGGAALQVTHDGGYNAFETADGQWLYVLNDGKIYRMRPDVTGAVPLEGSGISPNFWTIGGHNVFVFDSHHHTLWKAPFGPSTFEKAREFSPDVEPEGGGLCFAVPADESYVIFRSTTRSKSTAMLIENFR